MKRAAGICFFIRAIAFHPNAPTMPVDDALRNRQAQARTRTLKFRRACGMQRRRSHPIELLKDQFVMLCINPDACILDSQPHTARISLSVFLEDFPSDV